MSAAARSPANQTTTLATASGGWAALAALAALATAGWEGARPGNREEVNYFADFVIILL